MLATPVDHSVPGPVRNESPAPVRYAAFDNDEFSMYATTSPSAAKRALEAHLTDTDRRIQDASKLGTTLVQQRKDLAAKLKEVELIAIDGEVPSDLRDRLLDLEREFNELGRDSARAFLPKSRVVSDVGPDGGAVSSTLTPQPRDSPAKLSAPSRRQRNQPSNRVHDIEFATEISTALLAQVRQLQAALAEKDDVLKDTSASNAQLESEATAMMLRLKQMAENEQQYKDENWNLETRLQDLEASFKTGADRESRLAQTLKTTQFDMAAKERELDDLRSMHDKLNDEHVMAKRVQEADLHGLRRDAAAYEIEKSVLHRKVEELTLQNTELAKAVSYRLSQTVVPSDTDFVSADETLQSDDAGQDFSDPPSPIKGTPARHGILETETLKSSLNHAHRMIQNLKNNIHREKTEKIELKRMLQDTRDELEVRRGEPGGNMANVARKRRTDGDLNKSKKPTRAEKLGASRSATTEIIDDDDQEDEPDWEDHLDASTPSKPRNSGWPSIAAAGVTSSRIGRSNRRLEDTDTSDAFETANERELTTESEAFATGAEELSDDTEGEMTETENSIVGGTRRVASGISTMAGDRRSFLSTASTSADEEDDEIIKTPVQGSQQPKYKLRMSRGGRRSDRVAREPSASPSNSPFSTESSAAMVPGMQTLGDELDAFDDDSLQGTPTSHRYEDSQEGTPATERHVTASPETPTRQSLSSPGFSDSETIARGLSYDLGASPVAASSDDTAPRTPLDFVPQQSAVTTVPLPVTRDVKPPMVSIGIMTDPWEPVSESSRDLSPLEDDHNDVHSAPAKSGSLLGATLAGLGLGRFAAPKTDGPTTQNADNAISAPSLSMHSANEPMRRDIGEGTASHVTKSPPNGSFLEAHEPMRRGSSDAVSPPNNNPSSTHGSSVAQSSLPAQRLADASHSQPQDPLSFSAVLWQEFVPSLAANSQDNSAKQTVTPATSLTRSSETPGVTDYQQVNEDSKQAPIASVTAQDDAAHKELIDRSRSGTTSSERSVRFVDDDHQRNPFSSETVAVNGKSNIISGVATNQSLTDELTSPTSTYVQRTSQNGRLQDNKKYASFAPKQPSSMADSSSQTTVSGRDLDAMLSGNITAATSFNETNRPSGPSTLTVPNVSFPLNYDRPEGLANDATIRAPRRPASSGSIRSKFANVPPLPADHSQKIALAQQDTAAIKAPASPVHPMGPPLMPASAYKTIRPRTPNADRGSSRDGTTVRATRGKDGRLSGLSGNERVSQRTSMSSFASELDERFNINRGNIMYPHDVDPATDPRMIQAITQTMIGEWLWKYTRKAGRSEASSTRHRRFFWVHPYTRTLYWSEQDPSSAGKAMLKAKSVAIEAVRVTSDDNAYPPGLHRKSLVVVTPGREIIFTAPTGQRHETWFNALSYLLLRTGQDRQELDETGDGEEAEESGTRRGRGLRGSISKMTRRSQSHGRASLSSYNSRTTRNSSTHRQSGVNSRLSHRQSVSALPPTDGQPPTLRPQHQHAKESTRPDKAREAATGSMSGRLSSFASRFRSLSTHGAASQGRADAVLDPAQLYDASVVADSAEDIRAVMERQELEADRLENVRACCDGKHDVGSLPRSGRHLSFGNRFSTHAHNHHSHTHS